MEYQPLTLRNAIGFAAPHTWAAAILPTLLGSALSINLAGVFSPVLLPVLLAAMILMQSSVNTLNDYYDFIKGTDQAENSDDPSDAVLVYNRLNPRHVKLLGAGYLLAALLLGICAVWRGGMTPLVIGLLGCLVIVAYSAGPFPLSYLPVGELVSGLVMGGLITVAVFASYTGRADWQVLLFSLPLIIGIGLMNMTNNICDIERDRGSGRRTLPVLLGRKRSSRLYGVLTWLWPATLVWLVWTQFPGGKIPLLVVLTAASPVFLHLCRLGKLPEQRGACMGTVLRANILAGMGYLAAILLDLTLG